MNTLVKKQIRPMIEKIVEETFNREIMKIRASLLSYVSKAEQEDIEKRYKRPSGKTIKTIRVRI